MSPGLKIMAVLAAAGVVAAVPAAAPPVLSSPPVCTGISDVSDFDGTAATDLDGSLETVRIASGLTRPLLVTSPPGDTARLFIVQQDGAILLRKNGVLPGTAFLDISALTRSPGDPPPNTGGNEEGLLGLAFHPNYASNGWFFIYHTDTTGNQNQVARYTRIAGNPDIADPASRVDVIQFAHPTNNNHYGGCMVFGPSDGLLYIGTGDCGASCDLPGNAQSTASNLGKLLRIDVTSLPYQIPSGNPFAAGGGNPEIWLMGLRNPWRFTFDAVTGNTWIADVGQDVREEVDCVPPASGGSNLGWDRYEGSVCPNSSCGNQGSCTIASNILPVQQYTHAGTGGCSVTGGPVYRGCRMSDLAGTYFYSDWCAAFLRSFRGGGACAVTAGFLTRTTDLAPGGGLSINSVTSFGEDARGEVYIVDQGGEVFKIVPALRLAESSGRGAAPMLLPDGGTWSWEDVAATDERTISTYRVYRALSPTVVFSCAHQGAASTWPGGDPAVPATGTAYFYLATARNAVGEETRGGFGSNGTPRNINTASACP